MIWSKHWQSNLALNNREKIRKEKSFVTNEDEEGLRKNLEELIRKVGVLDLREFIAINKFLIEAEEHNEIMNKIKGRFLSLAIERMDETKVQEVRTLFKVLFSNIRILTRTTMSQPT
jgi:hypothetical protein